jgi:DNA-binding SARP family transcriptional activator
MNKPDTAVEILTLGRFSLFVDGKTVAVNWPDEVIKVLFCSLLSPLDLYVSWDRVCRTMWAEPVTQCRQRLEEILIQPVNSFLIKELGFNPLITGDEGIKIDQGSIHIDAFEFHRTALEGLRLLSLNSHAAAFEKFSRAKSLYLGSYLPGMTGKIISNTRNELESLYLTAILDAMPQTRHSFFGGENTMTEFGQHLNASRRPYQADLT